MRIFSYKFHYLAQVFLLTFLIASRPTAAQTKTRDDAAADQEQKQSGSTDSVRTQPVLKEQIKTGIHHLGTDIQSAFSTLKKDIKEAGNATDNLGDKKGSKYDSVASVGRPGDKILTDDEKHKDIIRTYDVSPRDKLDITNKYGDVSVVTWTKPQIKVEITISVKGSSGDQLQELLNQITVVETRQPEVIGLTTHIGDMGRSTWDSWMGKHSTINYQINYKIYMPRQNAMGLTNKYGKINLPDLDGALDISSAYGSLVSGVLVNPKNLINVRYGKAAIQELGIAVLDIAYSDLVLTRGDIITVSHKYGNLKVGVVNQLNGDIAYSQVSVSELGSSARLNLRYVNKFDLDRIRSSAKNIYLDASYSRLNINAPAAALDFDVDTHYGSFDYPSANSVMKNDPDRDPSGPGFSKHYTGKLGKGADCYLHINSNYSNITISK